jgi:hypothetical protein
MKRVGLFLMLAIALMLSGSAMAVPAPGGDNSTYFVTYYANNVSGAPDATVRFINDGDNGYLCADFYVFDDSQELVACGSCYVSVDGLLSEDVKTELTNNPITGHVPSRGVIKVISDYLCNNQDTPEPYPGLRGWATHIQRSTATSGAYATTEAPVADSNLASGEESLLGNLCYYAGQLGSGQGNITCTPEDHDF